MKKELIKAIEAAERYNLFLKVVTSVRSYDSYNSFLIFTMNMKRHAEELLYLLRQRNWKKFMMKIQQKK